jgi:transposase
LASLMVPNDATGHAAAVEWIARQADGSRVIVGLEGTRSYGIGLARALTAAGLTVVEVEHPKREQRRGRGKSDPVDAHLAVLAVLRMQADRLPIPRCDGEREALRILLGARSDLVTGQTRWINQLRALLLGGDDRDRVVAHGRVSQAWLEQIIRRRGNSDETRERAVRRAEARRLAMAIRDAERDLKANRASWPPSSQTSHPACSTVPASVRSARPRPSSPGHTRDAAAMTQPSPRSPALTRSLPAAAAPSAIGSIAAATAASTRPCTPSPQPAGEPAHAPTPTSNGAVPKAKPTAKSAASSSAISPGSSTEPSLPPGRLDKHRSPPRHRRTAQRACRPRSAIGRTSCLDASCPATKRPDMPADGAR